MRYLALLLGVIHCTLFAKEPQLIIYTEHFPPYSFQAEDQITGINIELVKEACHIAKIGCSFEILPWSRAMKSAQYHKNSGIASTSRSFAREKLFQWVGPLVSGKNYFFKLKSRNDINATSLQDLTKYTVAANRNDIYEKILIDRGFVKGRTLLDTSSQESRVKLFFDGKLDLLIASSITLPTYLHERGYDSSIIEPVLPLKLPELQGNYLALNLAVNKKLTTQLNKAVEYLIESGRVKKIVDSFTANKSPLPNTF